jgi:hypothetical protein
VLKHFYNELKRLHRPSILPNSQFLEMGEHRLGKAMANRQGKVGWFGNFLIFVWVLFTLYLFCIGLYSFLSSNSSNLTTQRKNMLITNFKGISSLSSTSYSQPTHDASSISTITATAVRDEKKKPPRAMTIKQLKKISQIASKLKIYVYPLPHGYNINAIKMLRKHPKQYRNFFQSSADLYFHQRLLHASTLYTDNPEEADYFYLPIYTSAMTLMHVNSKTARDKTRKIILNAIKRAKKLPFWDRHEGRDHIFIFPHSFGACIGNPYDEYRNEDGLHAKLMKQIGNSIFLTYDAQQYEEGELIRQCYNPEKDIVIPPLVNVQRLLLQFKKSKQGKLIIKMIKNKSYKRTQLMLMAGRSQLEVRGDPWFAIVVLYGSYQEQTMRPRITPSKHKCWRRPDLSLEECAASCDAELSRGRVFSRGVRQKIHQLYQHDSRYKHVKVGKQYKDIEWIAEMRKSIFCLTPRGISSWNIQTYEAAILGCIPVIIADDAPLPFEKFLPYNKMTLQVRESHVSRIILNMEQRSKDWVKTAQKYLKLHSKAFTYTRLKNAKKKKQFWTVDNDIGLNGDETIEELVNLDDNHGPDAFELIMMELAVKKMKNTHKLKRQNADKKDEEVLLKLNTVSLIDYLFNPSYFNAQSNPGNDKKIFNYINKNLKTKQGHVIKFPSRETVKRVHTKYIDKYLIKRQKSYGLKHALIFQGSVGTSEQDIGVILDQWKKSTVGSMLSELDITMSLGLEDAGDKTLYHLEKTAKAWGGYVSVGIVAVGSNTIEKIAFKIHAYKFRRGKFTTDKILFSIVEPNKPSALGDVKDTDDKVSLYPMNRARNAALSNVLTQHVLLWENGVLLSDESKHSLRRSQKSVLTWNDKTAIVIPTFEFTTATFAGKGIPATKHNLVWNIKNEELQPYGMVGDAFKYYTHATNNKQWYESSKAIYAEYEIGYQPLLLLRTPVVPFDETFPGTYLSRMHHTYELYASGFIFLVHSTAFAVTIDAGVAARIQADADLTGQWLAPWSCWRQFTDRIEKEYEGFVYPEPCWMSKEVWPSVNEKYGNKCAS